MVLLVFTSSCLVGGDLSLGTDVGFSAVVPRAGTGRAGLFGRRPVLPARRAARPYPARAGAGGGRSVVFARAL